MDYHLDYCVSLRSMVSICPSRDTVYGPKRLCHQRHASRSLSKHFSPGSTCLRRSRAASGERYKDGAVIAHAVNVRTENTTNFFCKFAGGVCLDYHNATIATAVESSDQDDSNDRLLYRQVQEMQSTKSNKRNRTMLRCLFAGSKYRWANTVLQQRIAKPAAI